MSSTDFVDEDLAQQNDPAKEAPRQAPPGAGETGRMAQKKEDVTGQVAEAMDELERLRSRQEALEREKALLESLRSNQEKYELGKREMIERLEQSMVTLGREEMQINQRLVLLGDTSKRFRDMLSEIRGINEDAWPTDTVAFREELAKTLVVIEDMRKEYGKSLARIEALKDTQIAAAAKDPAAGGLFDNRSGNASDLNRGFGFWVKVGFGLSLPLIAFLIIAVALVMLFAR